MIRLQTYSRGIFFITVFLKLITVYSGEQAQLYIYAFSYTALWLLLEGNLLEKTPNRFSGRVSIVLEALAVMWIMIVTDEGLFGIFLSLIIFRVLYQGIPVLAVTGLITIFYGAVLAVYLLIFHGSKGVSGRLLMLFPAILMGIIGFLFTRETEKSLREEIEAQQAQIDGKNKLLSTLSHELRTPLAVIKTSSEILLEERPGPLNAVQRRFLKAVQDNTIRMAGFVDSILASIKVEYAWFRMKKKEMDIRPVIKKVCNDLEPFISAREQSIRYTYPNLLSRAVIDDNWIQQVLINLIHNASKHLGGGGRIIVSVNENEQCIVVSVSDDGTGIVNDEKPKIFSEFYQGKDSPHAVEENFDGVGLGLSIVKNVIEKHGGDVYVGSVSGLGTTLSFTLPKAGTSV